MSQYGFVGQEQEYQPVRQHIVYDGKRLRKRIGPRKTIDFNPSVLLRCEERATERDYRDRPFIPPRLFFLSRMFPANSTTEQSATVFCTRHVSTAMNKVRHPVNVVSWMPEGRRLVTGSSSGELTLWNGLTFNFELVWQAHYTAVRAIVWTHNGDYMISGDNSGTIKYWQPDMSDVKDFKAHTESVRGITFAPTDIKFATCADDSLIKIWDFATHKEETVLQGHGWDVKTIAWHPYKNMLVSGSKDNLIKIWDPKSGNTVSTLHAHKNTVVKVDINRNGNWLLTASRDQLIKLFDIRTMKEIQTFRGHKHEVCTTAWHPFQEELFVSGGSDGSIYYWLVGMDNPQAEIVGAHDNIVWSLDFHPLGHILCSGGNDHTTKFWTRSRPGDEITDKEKTGTTFGMSSHVVSFDYTQNTQKKEELKAGSSRYALPGLTTPGPGFSIPGLSGSSRPFSAGGKSADVKSLSLFDLPKAPSGSATQTERGGGQKREKNQQQGRYQVVPTQQPPPPPPPSNSSHQFQGQPYQQFQSGQQLQAQGQHQDPQQQMPQFQQQQMSQFQQQQQQPFPPQPSPGGQFPFQPQQQIPQQGIPPQQY